MFFKKCDFRLWDYHATSLKENSYITSALQKRKIFFSEQTRQSYYDNNSDQSTDLILIGYLINSLKNSFFKNIYISVVCSW